MQTSFATWTLLAAVVVAAPGTTRRVLPVVQSNPNTERAGVLHDGVLTLALEAKPSLWRFNVNQPAMTIDAFAEAGKAPRMPGPFIRVPAGTQIRLTIRNSLPLPLTFILPATLHGGPDRITAIDSVMVAPGTVGTLTTRADVPGSYVYRGKTTDGASRVSNIGGMLAGAIVVDTVVTPATPRDRVLVIMATEDSISAACDDTTSKNPRTECPARRFMYTINGAEWPNTDRIHATVGDSLHWRVINASAQVHPMHLHGFYFRVDDLTGPFADEQARPVPGQMVVTQLLQPLGAMSMTWSPDRPGNWLFHCHVALHNTPYSLMHTSDDPTMHGMVGLIVGVIVAPRPGVVAAGHPGGERRLRLVAERSDAEPGTAAAETAPGMHFVLDERGQRIDTHRDISPELNLVRGQPVAITIVNHLDEPTSVHWHGVEVEDSYVDGAPGFSGAGKHLAPAIAPGDSFVARFTPMRSGTFMYHAHVDEMRQEIDGMEGVLIVRDAREPAATSSLDDRAFLFKGDVGTTNHPIEINGQSSPDTVVLHAGQPARFRLLNLSASNNTAAPAFWLTARMDNAIQIARDTTIVRWQPVAKDAFDLPASARTPRLAQQIVGVGETFDFEYTPERRGTLRLEVRGASGQHRLFIGVPIRVE